jgi:hypothetical protein
MWTEDYQVVTLTEHFKAFDTLYKEGFLIGEMIWNFADFATPQGNVFYVYVWCMLRSRRQSSGPGIMWFWTQLPMLQRYILPPSAV